VRIDKIILTNFRNFTSKKIEFSKSLVLFVGSNGVGKTNILEALALLGRNSSLRGADFEEMINIRSEEKKFSVFAHISNHEFVEKIALSFNLADKKKITYINDEPFNSKRQGDLKNNLINFICLTPSLEQLFILGKSERRNYLDKIVSDIDFAHHARLNNYQKLLKERLIILQKYRGKNNGDKWLDIVENNIVELGVAIASARVETVEFFNKAIGSFTSNFPKTKLEVIGEIEGRVNLESAVKIEEFYKEMLKKNRAQDLENFKTDFGVHRSDFDAIFLDKNISATFSSTGEQKAIMLSITMARARISASYRNHPTILIFDEVASHLDEKRKSDLLEEISQIGLQAYFSATSKELVPSRFLDAGEVEIIEV
jgi:DNA replication and repair protein RecF